MNTDKLFKSLIKDESIQDIPMSNVVRVFFAIIRLINSGDFYFVNE